jgi:hypothetical protein
MLGRSKTTWLHIFLCSHALPLVQPSCTALGVLWLARGAWSCAGEASTPQASADMDLYHDSIINWEYIGKHAHRQESDGTLTICRAVQAALDAPDWLTASPGYTSFIDGPNWVDYFLLVELTKNPDGYRSAPLHCPATR